jgi:dynein heavy chain
VQKQWIYLESIFASQQNEQDKQLMGDIAKFQKIEKQFQKYMLEIWADRNVKRALGKDGFLKDLQDMSKRLDES